LDDLKVNVKIVMEIFLMCWMDSSGSEYDPITGSVICSNKELCSKKELGNAVPISWGVHMQWPGKIEAAVCFSVEAALNLEWN
jgi:hypothetical protein